MQKVILITGGSSGMGKVTAKTLITAGHIVYGAARRVEKMQDFVDAGGHAIGMDITVESHVQNAVDLILSEQGHIDILINNAGYAVYGAVEQVSLDDARRQFIWVSLPHPENPAVHARARFGSYHQRHLDWR